MLSAGAIFISAGIIMLIVVIAQSAQNRSFAQSSESATGTITRKRARKRKRGITPEFTVSFTVDGIEYEAIVGALKSELKDYDIGDKIEIKYKPGNPKRAIRPEALEPQNVHILWIITIGLLVVGAIAFGVGMIVR